MFQAKSIEEVEALTCGIMLLSLDCQAEKPAALERARFMIGEMYKELPDDQLHCMLDAIILWLQEYINKRKAQEHAGDN